MAAGLWRLWIDTGGTFTDCLAVTPEGELRRAKVLSSGRLRARVAEVAGGGREVRLAVGWNLPPGMLRGFRLRSLGGGAAPVEVVESGPGGSHLTLAEPVPLATGSGVELDSGEEAPVVGARWLTGTPLGCPFPPLAVRLATTRGTNALLERRGAPVALFITRGFADLLEIGSQQRPDLFALEVRKPEPLQEVVVEVDERLDAQGAVVRPLDVTAAREEAAGLVARGVRCAAVALLHSYRNPAHEESLAEEIRRAGFEHVSCSAQLVGRIKIVPRAETAVADAYLAPVIARYLERVGGAFRGGGSLHVMTSAGGLHSAESFHPKDSLLSGPAGGVVGAARAGALSGERRIIAFDMGGTSTDVSRWAGELEYRFETRVGDAHLMAPALAIETVAAGGGSICSFDGHRLKVGPESAGADPGPACYGAGGPLSLTDVNLLLGRLVADRFGIPVAERAAREAAAALLATVEADGRRPVGRERMLSGLLRIANERMAEAVREISVRRGYDPSDHALVAFGGAGGQHACALAELLGIRRILVPADASLLSAHGLGWARVERFAEREVLGSLASVAGELPAELAGLGERAMAALAGEGVEPGGGEIRLRRITLRIAGQGEGLELDWEGGAALEERFARAYRRRYGYPPPEREIEVETLRVVASTTREPAPEAAPAAPAGEAEPQGSGRGWFGGGWQQVPRFERGRLQPGQVLRGPALVLEPGTATVVEEGWQASCDGAGALRLERQKEEAERGAK